MKKIFLGMLVCMLSFVSANAQIGYQVSLLNSATGEPRSNETVSANIVITDAQNKTVYSTTQSATTNDFGILSFVVGNADTFKDVAIGRLPLYISVTVGGTLIGKSQILNVPVAEVANTLKSDFTLEELCGKEWIVEDDDYEGYGVTFHTNGTCIYRWFWGTGNDRDTFYNGTYEIVGNTIYVYINMASNYYYVGVRNHLIVFRFYNSKLHFNRL